jgi:Flp pilus assembly pilin Flp
MFMMSGIFRRFLTDERGQDLLEYGLLAAIIGTAGYLVLPLIGPKMAGAFQLWGGNIYNAWQPPNPAP